MTDLSNRSLSNRWFNDDQQPGTLRDRLPAQALIEQCVQARGRTRDRTRLQRLFGIRPLPVDARPWYRGALGELRVARELENLGSEWTVLHSVPVGERGSDIDHVVIGPSGVFTLNTKFHERQRVWVGGGTLKVGGYATQHLRNSQFEGGRASRMLSRASGIDVVAHPLVVIVAAESIGYGTKKPIVPVVALSRLRPLLRRSRRTLSTAECAYLADVAADPLTWCPVIPPPAEPGLRARFDALHREMRSAFIVRTAWSVGLALAVALAAAGYLWSVIPVL